MENKAITTQDSEAEDSSLDEAAPDTSAAPAAPKKSAGLLIVILLLVLVTGAATAAAYYLWQQQQTLQNSQTRLAEELRSQINRSNENNRQLLNQRLEEQQQQIQQLQNELKTLEDLSQSALQISKRGQRGWMLAEVDYLMRLANRRLQVARDINGAIAALGSASERLYDLGDLRLFPVRKQLAEEIAQLKSIKQEDINGIAMTLDQMSLHVGELPFKSIQEEIKNQVQSDEQPAVIVSGNEFADSLISTIMRIGDIKIHQRSIQPASSAMEQQQIEEILNSHLLAARLAVLRYDQKQFAYDIKQALKLLSQHYQSDDNRVMQMQKDLQGFESIDLTPKLPSVTGSWELLQQLLITSEKDKSLEAKK